MPSAYWVSRLALYGYSKVPHWEETDRAHLDAGITLIISTAIYLYMRECSPNSVWSELLEKCLGNPSQFVYTFSPRVQYLKIRVVRELIEVPSYTETVVGRGRGDIGTRVVELPQTRGRDGQRAGYGNCGERVECNLSTGA